MKSITSILLATSIILGAFPVSAAGLFGVYHADRSQYTGSVRDFVEVVHLEMKMDFKGSEGSLNISMEIPDIPSRPVVTPFKISPQGENFIISSDGGTMLVTPNPKGILRVTCISACEQKGIPFPEVWIKK